MSQTVATAAPESAIPAVSAYARLAHVGIAGPDPAGLAEFYKDFFGQELTGSFAPVNALFMSSCPAEEHHEVAIFGDQKYRHVAFRTDSPADLAAYYRAIKARGLPMVMVADHGVSVEIMFVDPAGNLCEVYLPTESADGEIQNVPLDEEQFMARLGELS